jgi:hypothetical protein
MEDLEMGKNKSTKEAKGTTFAEKAAGTAVKVAEITARGAEAPATAPAKGPGDSVAWQKGLVPLRDIAHLKLDDNARVTEVIHSVTECTRERVLAEIATCAAAKVTIPKRLAKRLQDAFDASIFAGAVLSKAAKKVIG